MIEVVVFLTAVVLTTTFCFVASKYVVMKA